MSKTRKRNETYYPRLTNTELFDDHCPHCKSCKLIANTTAQVSAKRHGGKWNIASAYAHTHEVQYQCRMCGHAWCKEVWAHEGTKGDIAK